MKQYFKVVRYTGNRLVSVMMVGRTLERTYSTTEWTQGVNSTPVMAFETRRSAKNFANGWDEVWLAKVRRPRKLARITYCDSRKDAMLAFWAGIKGKRWSTLRNDGSVEAPDGTVACEAIRLVRKVS
jgi:hypothetical protein